MVVSLGQMEYNPLKILSGQQESAAVKTEGLSLCGMQIPSAFTGTTITFEACDTVDGTYVPVYNSVGQVSYTVAPSRFVAVDPKDFYGIQFLKIKSGTAEGADRIVICSMKGI